jgi:hypothetical protein
VDKEKLRWSVNALWRRFADEGTIASEEYVGMTLPQYYKTVEERL